MISITALLVAGAINTTQWEPLAHSPAGTFYVQPTSFKRTTMRGLLFASIAYKYEDAATKEAMTFRWHIRVADCTQGFGALVSTQPDSNDVVFSNNYTLGGQTTGSIAAKYLCNTAKAYPLYTF
jgi:hypothetical protein